jgi:hypothetical protein
MLFVLFDRATTPNRDAYNQRTRAIYTWAYERDLTILDEYPAWDHDATVPKPEALIYAIDEAQRHHAGLLVWQAHHSGPPATIPWTVQELDPLPAIAVHTQAQVGIGEHNVVTLMPMHYPIVRTLENREKTQ